ncbi:Uncharacterised protein [Mycobacteroides abscessus subsp. abscessus]|nr:Uncharacterised protein [Mycobacteroides abscessus subsp. abscessus]
MFSLTRPTASTSRPRDSRREVRGVSSRWRADASLTGGHLLPQPPALRRASHRA